MPHGNGISVETTVVASVVPASAPWRVVVSVDAKRLIEVCDGFKKVGAFRTSDDQFELSVVSGQLKVKFHTTAVSLPIL